MIDESLMDPWINKVFANRSVDEFFVLETRIAESTQNLTFNKVVCLQCSVARVVLMDIRALKFWICWALHASFENKVSHFSSFLHRTCENIDNESIT